MKTFRIFSAVLIAFAVFAAGADAQKRPAKRPAPKPKATPNTVVSSLEIRTAKEKVSNQVTNVTLFTDRLGPIAANIEAIDADSRTNRVSRPALDKNDANKEKVRTAIKNLRAGLVTLETEFRTKPGLRKFLPNIEGITVLSAEAEDMANAGRFTESRRPLLTVLQKLSDTLAVLK
ncbi:MAG: hypothetical protein ACR2IH_08175 [Pyrinomonadaceae bacterium]